MVVVIFLMLMIKTVVCKTTSGSGNSIAAHSKTVASYTTSGCGNAGTAGNATTIPQRWC